MVDATPATIGSSSTVPAPVISVVVPVLNEEKGLGPLIDRLRPVLDGLGLGWELIVVDDGSRDGTLGELRRRNAADPRIKAVSFSRNFGKEIAIAAGLRHASGAAVVLMDGDLQHPPELIPEFIARWREGYEIVFAVRSGREAEPALRRFSAQAFYRVFHLITRTELPEGAGDFRLLDRRAVIAMNTIGERVRFNKGLFSWIGFKSVGVPFDVAPRINGGSRWRPRLLLRFALDGLTSFSTVPLRVWSYVGVAVSVFAFLYSLVFLVKTLVFGTDVPGFPTLVISVMFLGGIQLISLGIIGEYLGRVYEEVKGRPLYVVAERLGLTGETTGDRDGRATTGGAPAATRQTG